MPRGIATLVLACLVALAPTSALPAAAAEPVGTDVRVLNWNIWLGGTGAGAENLPLLLDQVVAVAPDVFFAVETYGAGEQILAALNGRVGKGRYHAAQITPGNGISQDNLWIFTRFPIVAVYPPPSNKDISAFNFGGVRVRLPNGRAVNLFDTWFSFNSPWVGDLIERNADDILAGQRPTHSASKVRNAESAGLADVRGAISSLPGMLGGNTDPIIMAGDFNTVPAADWSTVWAGCASHTGQSYPLRITSELISRGFVDTYRAANPDACASPGGTWSPHHAYDTPQRIDFTFTKGAPIATVDSYTVDERLAAHPPGGFYSDHAAVVTDLCIHGANHG